jgi:hypothetical protein
VGGGCVDSLVGLGVGGALGEPDDSGVGLEVGPAVAADVTARVGESIGESVGATGGALPQPTTKTAATSTVAARSTDLLIK